MCSDNDIPPYDATDQEDDAYDIVASIDWEAVRAIQHRQIADVMASMDATPGERLNGIPERPGYIEREYDRMRHMQARRGEEYRS